MTGFGYTRIGFPKPSPAIARLMIVNLAVFALNFALGGKLSERVDGSGMWFAVSWGALWEGYGLGLLRLLTYQFTHDYGSPWHLVFNMFVLFFVGTIAEGALGYRGTYKLYLTGGLVAATVHMLAYWPSRGVHVPVVGASGSCYALLLFAAAVAPRLELILLIVPVQLIFVAFLAVGYAVYGTVTELRDGRPSGISHMAHLGGAAFGYAAFRFRWFRDYKGEIRLFASLRARFHDWRAKKSAEDAVQSQQQLDDILEKVHGQGLHSLTPAERRFLDRVSQRSRKR